MNALPEHKSTPSPYPTKDLARKAMGSDLFYGLSGYYPCSHAGQHGQPVLAYYPRNTTTIRGEAAQENPWEALADVKERNRYNHYNKAAGIGQTKSYDDERPMVLLWRFDPKTHAIEQRVVPSESVESIQALATPAALTERTRDDVMSALESDGEWDAWADVPPERLLYSRGADIGDIPARGVSLRQCYNDLLSLNFTACGYTHEVFSAGKWEGHKDQKKLTDSTRCTRATGNLLCGHLFNEQKNTTGMVVRRAISVARAFAVADEPTVRAWEEKYEAHVKLMEKLDGQTRAAIHRHSDGDPVVFQQDLKLIDLGGRWRDKKKDPKGVEIPEIIETAVTVQAKAKTDMEAMQAELAKTLAPLLDVRWDAGAMAA